MSGMRVASFRPRHRKRQPSVVAYGPEAVKCKLREDGIPTIYVNIPRFTTYIEITWGGIYKMYTHSHYEDEFAIYKVERVYPLRKATA